LHRGVHQHEQGLVAHRLVLLLLEKGHVMREECQHALRDVVAGIVEADESFLLGDFAVKLQHFGEEVSLENFAIFAVDEGDGKAGRNVYDVAIFAT